VLNAEEAADLFQRFHRYGDIPGQYALRAVGGYHADESADEKA